MKQLAVPGKGHHARLHNNAHHVTRDHWSVALIEPVFMRFGISAHQLDGEGNLRGAGAGAVVIQTDVAHPIGFGNGELKITVGA
jgi:hypothetical protein